MAGNYDREIRKAMGIEDEPDALPPTMFNEPMQTESAGIPSQAIQDEYAARPTVDWDEILRQATAPNGFTSGMRPSALMEDRRNESWTAEALREVSRVLHGGIRRQGPAQ